MLVKDLKYMLKVRKIGQRFTIRLLHVDMQGTENQVQVSEELNL